MLAGKFWRELYAVLSDGMVCLSMHADSVAHTCGAADVLDRHDTSDYDVSKRGGWDSDKDGNVATLPPPTDTGEPTAKVCWDRHCWTGDCLLGAGCSSTRACHDAIWQALSGRR
jgi:hypothetical protein